MSKYIHHIIALLLGLNAQAAFSASFFWTDKAFLNSGAEAFIGEVTDVQVLSSGQDSESGTVQLQVTQVIAGNITVPSVAFSYQRTLSAADEESDWDLVEPKYVSLKTAALGKKFLIFFTEKNGGYFLASASNSVQDATRGLLIGEINNQGSSAVSQHADHREVQVKIIENIYGWISGSVATLPFDNYHACTQSTDVNRQTASNMGQSPPIPDLLDKKLIIVYDKGGICAIRIADEKSFEEIQDLDSQ